MLKQYRRLIILLMLLVLGLFVGALGDTLQSQVMSWGTAMAGRPWAIAVIILIQILLFTAAMPGSMVLLLVSPFYPPVQATLILTAGTVGGGLGAYAVATKLGEAARNRLSARKGFRILSQRSDFMTQCAMRVLPGFPHAIINYGAGVLRLPLWKFILATIAAALVKWSVYSSAIHGVVEAQDINQALTPGTLLPLLLLALFLAFGSWLASRFQNGKTA